MARHLKQTVSQVRAQGIANTPLRSRPRSKFRRCSNIRRSCSADKTLRICKCRYSRWNLVLLHKHQHLVENRWRKY